MNFDKLILPVNKAPISSLGGSKRRSKRTRKNRRNRRYKKNKTCKYY